MGLMGKYVQEIYWERFCLEPPSPSMARASLGRWIGVLVPLESWPDVSIVPLESTHMGRVGWVADMVRVMPHWPKHRSLPLEV